MQASVRDLTETANRGWGVGRVHALMLALGEIIRQTQRRA